MFNIAFTENNMIYYMEQKLEMFDLIADKILRRKIKYIDLINLKCKKNLNIFLHSLQLFI